jgi:hypothetical protein
MSPKNQLTTLSDLLERRNDAKRVLREAEKEVEEFVAATQIVAQQANNRPLPTVERTPGVRAAVRELLSRHTPFVQRAD